METVDPLNRKDLTYRIHSASNPRSKRPPSVTEYGVETVGSTRSGYVELKEEL